MPNINEIVEGCLPKKLNRENCPLKDEDVKECKDCMVEPMCSGRNRMVEATKQKLLVELPKMVLSVEKLTGMIEKHRWNIAESMISSDKPYNDVQSSKELAQAIHAAQPLVKGGK